MPPGVPADRVAAMQKAMTDTFKDPAFLEEAKKRQLDVGSPRTGQELHGAGAAHLHQDAAARDHAAAQNHEPGQLTAAP